MLGPRSGAYQGRLMIEPVLGKQVRVHVPLAGDEEPAGSVDALRLLWHVDDTGAADRGGCAVAHDDGPVLCPRARGPRHATTGVGVVKAASTSR